MVTFSVGAGDPNGDALFYVWNFGDGTTFDSGTSSTTSHPYTVAGTFPVTLTITDSASRTSQTTKSVVVP